MGNILRGDDGAGIYIIEKLSNNKNINTLKIESGIENYIGKIISKSPEVMIIFDAIHFNDRPGKIKIFPIDNLFNYPVISHGIPLEILINIFFRENIKRIYVVGIQPGSIKIGDHLSKRVKKNLDQLIKSIIKILG